MGDVEEGVAQRTVWRIAGQHVEPTQRQFGLRTRIVASFVVLSALLALIISLATYLLVQNSMVERRESIATSNAFANARLVRELLLDEADHGFSDGGDSAEYLPRSPAFGVAALRYGSIVQHTTSNFIDGSFNPQNDLPPGLQAVVANHQTAIQRVRLKGSPVLVVGIALRVPAGERTLSADGPSSPAAADWAEYYEVISLADIEQALRRLATALIVMGLSATAAGAVTGRWVSHRVLAPLVEMNSAVHALATMSFDTKLPATGDPDLAPLVSSFNHTVAALQERIDRDGRFASDVGHELRSPLTTLTHSIDVLRRYLQEMPVPAQQAVALLGEEFDRFRQLIGDLLEISRFDAGAQQLQRSPLMIGELVRHAAHLTIPDCVSVSIDEDLEDVVIMADKRRLVQVLSNLSVNAQKYAGGVTEFRVTRVVGGVEIAVLDRGPGIAVPDRRRIFERFSRGSTAGNRGSDQGTGLGLALVREHVKLHGGTVEVQDRPDGETGACFVVFLPANPVSIYDTAEDFEAAGFGLDP